MNINHDNDDHVCPLNQSLVGRKRRQRHTGHELSVSYDFQFLILNLMKKGPNVDRMTDAA